MSENKAFQYATIIVVGIVWAAIFVVAVKIIDAGISLFL